MIKNNYYNKSNEKVLNIIQHYMHKNNYKIFFINLCNIIII